MSVIAQDIAPIVHVQKSRGYWASVLRRVCRDPVSIACTSIILLIVLAAIFAPWLGLADPYQGSMIRRLRPIGTPGYPWYCLPLVILAVLSGRFEWLAVAAASYPVYALYRVPHLPGVAFAVAGLVVLGTTWVSARHPRADPGGSIPSRTQSTASSGPGS